MRKKLFTAILSLVLTAQLIIPSVEVKAAQTYYDNKVGTIDGYNYELWKDYGNTSMTLNGGGSFSCQWDNIGNALFRTGIKFDNTKTYQQIGKITCNYGADFQPNGNSYLCVYGWTTNPLVEYYIVDSWGDWRPPGANSKGTITVDGGTYDVYETTRVNQPSIQGDTTFQQYWSVRTSKRTSGTITVTDHFKAWESMGMKCGNLYEAALNVEGYQSSGSANVYKHEMSVGGSLNSGSGSNGSNSNAGNFATPASGKKVEAESMSLSGQYAGKISKPFNGVALYANNDSVSFTQNFTKSTSDFTLRGCSNNDNMAKVDLIIGGENKGTFYYGDANPAEYTIKNVSHKTGNQKVELIVNSDDGKWDAYLDYFIVGGESDSSGSNAPAASTKPSAAASSNPSSKPGVTPSTKPSSTAVKVTVPSKFVVNGVEYPNTSIPNGAFKNNKTVTTITMPTSIKTIGKDAFNGCSKLKNINLPKNVTTIGARAFKDCTSLTKITIPAKVSKLGANSFSGCKNLKTIIIKSTKLTKKNVAKNAFKGLSKNTTIKVPKKKLAAYRKLFKSKGFKGKVVKA